MALTSRLPLLLTGTIEPARAHLSEPDGDRMQTDETPAPSVLTALADAQVAPNNELRGHDAL